MKKIIQSFGLLFLCAALFAGCASAPVQESETSVFDTSYALESTLPEDSAEPSQESTLSKEESAAEADLGEEWDFRKGWQVYIGDTKLDSTLDMEFPVLSEFVLRTDDAYKQAGIHLLYHLRFQPRAAVRHPEVHPTYYSGEFLEEDALKACYAYLESLGLPLAEAENAEPIYPGYTAKVYHLTVSADDAKKLNKLAVENDIWLEFIPCECALLHSMPNAYEGDIPE